MNILFFTRRFYPDIGGVEKHVSEISKRLVLQGHKIIIVTESQNPSRKMHQKGIKVFHLPNFERGKRKKFLIWQWLWKNKTIIQEADIVHCHDVFYWYLPFRFLYLKKAVFTTFHGYESYPLKQKAIVIRKISEKLSWGNICIGDFIQKWYGTKPDYVSYGAVNSLKFKTSAKFPKKDSALFFGRLDEQTGILTYIKVFDQLKNIYPKFNLLVIGDGKFKKLLEKKTNVLGFQKDPEKYFEKYRFAFVSRYLSILEAFAAKRLVIAVYDDPIKEDYLKMAPFAQFMIIEKDPRIIAKQIQKFLENPILEKKMIEDAFYWVKEQTWEEMGELYKKLWTKAKV